MASAGAPTPAQVRRSPAPAATDPARPTRITQPEPRSLLPGALGPRLSDLEQQGQRPPRPWPGAAGQRWSGSSRTPLRQRAPMGRGTGHGGGEAAPARGALAETRAGWTETPPTAASLSPPPHYPALWASHVSVADADWLPSWGGAKKAGLVGVSCVLRSRSSPGGVKKGLSWESATRLAPGLWGILLLFVPHTPLARLLARPFPCLRPAARSATHCVCSPECGRRGTPQNGWHLPGSGDAATGNQRGLPAPS